MMPFAAAMLELPIGALRPALHGFALHAQQSAARGPRMLASEVLFLGDDLLPWLLLAFGAAMVVGNIFAMIKPPPDAQRSNNQTSKSQTQNGRGGTRPGGRPSSGAVEPNRTRMWVMVVIGAFVAVWALATLLS